MLREGLQHPLEQERVDQSPRFSYNRYNIPMEVIGIKAADFAFIALRILSIYLFARAVASLSQITYFLYSISQFPELKDNQILIPGILSVLTPFFAFLLMSIVLWIWSAGLVKILLPKQTSAAVGHVGSGELRTAAFTVVGLFLLVQAIPQIFTVIPRILNLHIDGVEMGPKYLYDTIFSNIQLIVRLALGTALLFGGKGLAGLIMKIREAGLKKTE